MGMVTHSNSGQKAQGRKDSHHMRKREDILQADSQLISQLYSSISHSFVYQLCTEFALPHPCLHALQAAPSPHQRKHS